MAEKGVAFWTLGDEVNRGGTISTIGLVLVILLSSFRSLDLESECPSSRMESPLYITYHS